MKGFIKITDSSEKEHYLNIDYIIKFTPIGKDYSGNAKISILGLEKINTITTSTTCEEIIDMIELAKG